VEIKQIPGESGKLLESALKKLQDKICKVGWIEKSKYPSTKYQKNPAFVAEVVVSNEFGNPSKNVPARPFMRPTIVREENAWKKIGSDGAKKLLKNQLKLEDILDAIGAKSSADIKKTISQIWSPSLKLSTIRNRISKYSESPDLAQSTRKSRKEKLKKFVPAGLYKPLIDTGLMLATLTYKVENE